MKSKYLLAVIVSLPFVVHGQLPQESADLISQLKNWELDQQVALQQEMKEKRKQVAAVLERHLEETTKAGDLEGALAIRKEIEKLSPPEVEEPKPKMGLGAQKPPRIPREAHRGTKSHYLWIDKELGWAEAQAECKRLGGNLVCIESEEEWEEVLSYRNDAGFRGRRFWIGFSAPASETEYSWVDGSDANFENWAAQPKAKPEIAGVAAGMAGSWIAYSKGEESRVTGFICEWPRK